MQTMPLEILHGPLHLGMLTQRTAHAPAVVCPQWLANREEWRGRAAQQYVAAHAPAASELCQSPAADHHLAVVHQEDGEVPPGRDGHAPLHSAGEPGVQRDVRRDGR